MCPCAHEHSTTLSMPLRECDRVYLAVRSNALIQGSHMTFLGHLPLSPLHFPSRRTAPSPILSVLLSYPSHPTTISPPTTHGHHLHPSSSHNHCTAHRHRRPHFPDFTPISLVFSPKPNFSKILSFCPFFLVSKGTYPSTGCAIFDYVLVY